METKRTINGLVVDDGIFFKMSMLQERVRRIDAEARILSMERSATEREIADLLSVIDVANPPA